jgi:hypothetical protein
MKLWKIREPSIASPVAKWRADPGTGLDRFAFLDHLVRGTAGRSRGGGPQRQPKPALPGAVRVALHLPMVMHVDESGNHDRRAGVDVSPVAPRSVRLDGSDPMALDHNVDIVK